MAAVRQDFVIEQGATFNPKVLYAAPTFTVIDITGITQSGRATVTAPSHGLSVDWPVYIVGVAGMTEINHRSRDLDIQEKAYQSRFGDSDTITLDLDTTDFTAYTSGGELMYRSPMDLTGFTARMQIRETIDADDFLIELTTENGGISLGGVAGTVEVLLAADDSADLDFTKGFYDLEIADTGTGKVTRLLQGHVHLNKEVTR